MDVGSERYPFQIGSSAGSSERTSLADTDLIRQIATRDEDAFRALVKRYGAAAQGLACRILHQPALAEEATQEAFLAVWLRPDGFDPARGTVRSWLMGVVHHRAVDRTRREQNQRDLTASLAVPSPEDDIADEVAIAIDRPSDRKRVREALERLPHDQREVLELMYFGGLSQSQVATALDIPLGTTKSRTLGGMRRLRVALTGMGPEPA